MKQSFTHKSLLTILLATVFSVAISLGQTINKSTVSPASVCQGGAISVAFTSATFPGGTTFTAQISDASGSFASPLATATGTSSAISITIPAGAAAGATYLARVISASPAVVGDASDAFTINAIPAAPTVTDKNYNVGDPPVSLALSVTGTNLLWYTAATGGTGSATPPTISTASAGTTSHWVTQATSAGSCESPRAKIDVIVTNACVPPAAPTVTNKNYTVGETPVSLELSVTGTNLLWYTAATGGTGSATPPAISTASAGTTSYWVTQAASAGSCESPRAKIDVIVTNACVPPAAPTVTNKNYTVGDTPVSLALSVTGTNLLWYTAATGGTGSATPPAISTASAGTTSYWVTQAASAGSCESPRAKIDVIVTNACVPPAAPTVTNKNYTVGDAPVSLALSVTGTNLLWYTAATGGTGSATPPAISTASAGTTSYWVTQAASAGSCESPRAKIDVIVSACTPPAAPGVSNVNYCLGEPTVALNATGSNLKWYNVASGGTGSATVPKPTSSSAGTTSYYVTQTVGACESPRAEIKVIVNQTAPPAVADLDYCLNATATPLTATGTALSWYTAASGGTGSPTAPTPTTNALGAKSYYVSQTLNGCESARAEIRVTVKNLSVLPTVTATVNICQNSTASALTATGTALKWYTAATGGDALAAAPVPVTTTAGTASYYVSQTAAGLCEGPRAKIDVVVKDTPLAPTVTPVQYCVGATATALTPSGGVYKWYNTETGGGTGSATAPTPLTTAAGTTSYYVTQSNTYGALLCESPRAKLDVTINATPAALTPLSDVFCQSKADSTYTFPTQAAQGNTLNWYTTATGGTASVVTPTVPARTVGETIFYVTQKTAKNCESVTRVIQKVRIKALPVPPAIAKPLVEYCQFIKADPLAATPATNASLNWYDSQNGGNPSAAAPTPSTQEGGTTSFYVSQTLEGCISERAKIDVKINTTPKPTTTTFLAFCQNETAGPLSATGSVLKWYREANGTEFQGVPFVPFTEKVQDYSFYVTQTGANGCESPKEEIKVHIKSLPSATISGGSVIDLGKSATINIKFTGDGPWTYVLSNGVTATTDQVDHQVEVKPSTTTTYVITEVSNACGKGLPIGSALVTVKVPTINSGNPSVAEVCAGKTFSIPFQQSGDFPAGNTFKVQVSSVNADAQFKTIPSVATANLVTATFPDTTKGGIYYVRVISSGANPDLTVKGSTSAITIIASPLPIATLSGAQTILVGESANLKAEITGKSPWTFTLNNGTKDSLITAEVSPYTFKVTPKATVTYTITKVTNGCGIGNGVGSARVQVDPILGVEPSAPANWVKVYPTVVQSRAMIEVLVPVAPKQASVQVIDLNGRPKHTQVIEGTLTELNLDQYPSGLYLIRVQNGNLNSVQRVMKP
jgi:hypothetical protein